MIIIGILFGVVGIGFLCWLLFSLAVYALPFFAAVSAGLWAYQGDAGLLGAIMVGILAGTVTLVAGQDVKARRSSPMQVDDWTLAGTAKARPRSRCGL